MRRTSIPIEAAASSLSRTLSSARPGRPATMLLREPRRADEQDRAEVPQPLELAERDAEHGQQSSVVEGEAGDARTASASRPLKPPVIVGRVEQDVLAEEDQADRRQAEVDAAQRARRSG